MNSINLKSHFLSMDLMLKLPLYASLCSEQCGLHTHLGIPLPVTLHSCDSPHLFENVWQPSENDKNNLLFELLCDVERLCMYHLYLI